MPGSNKYSINPDLVGESASVTTSPTLVAKSADAIPELYKKQAFDEQAWRQAQMTSRYGNTSKKASRKTARYLKSKEGQLELEAAKTDHNNSERQKEIDSYKAWSQASVSQALQNLKANAEALKKEIAQVNVTPIKETASQELKPKTKSKWVSTNATIGKGDTTYNVKAGNTLSQIVAAYNKSNGTKLKVQDVAAWSGVKDPSKIMIGQVIRFTNPNAEVQSNKPSVSLNPKSQKNPEQVVNPADSTKSVKADSVKYFPKRDSVKRTTPDSTRMSPLDTTKITTPQDTLRMVIAPDSTKVVSPDSTKVVAPDSVKTTPSRDSVAMVGTDSVRTTPQREALKAKMPDSLRRMPQDTSKRVSTPATPTNDSVKTSSIDTTQIVRPDTVQVKVVPDSVQTVPVDTTTVVMPQDTVRTQIVPDSVQKPLADSTKIKAEPAQQVALPIMSQSKSINNPKKRNPWFTNAILQAAMADSPAVMTASGWRTNEEGDVVQDQVHNPSVEALRRNLAILGASTLANTAASALATQGPLMLGAHPETKLLANPAKYLLTDGAGTIISSWKKGGIMNRIKYFQQGGSAQASQADAFMQAVLQGDPQAAQQLVQLANEGNKDAVQLIETILKEAQNGNTKVTKAAQTIMQLMQGQATSAKWGSKLNYIRSLKHSKGVKTCPTCEQKVEMQKCGGKKSKKKYFGGII